MHVFPCQPGDGRFVFSVSLLQQVGLHAQIGINPLRLSVFVLKGLHLAQGRDVRTPNVAAHL
jgi:hypothetical protein